MYNTKPITSIYLDSRRIKTDNTFPVKLRVTFQRKRKYYSILKESLSKEDFEKVMGDKPRGSYRTIRYKLDESKHDADEVIKNLKVRGQSRPRKVKTLSNTINSLFTEKMNEKEMSLFVRTLERKNFISISDDKVSYNFKNTR